MDFLGGLITHGHCLGIIGKPPPIGEAAGVVGRNQLGIGAEIDELLGMLRGRNCILPGCHAKYRGCLLGRGVVINKGMKQAAILPAGGAFIVLAGIHSPAHHLLFLDGKTVFIQGNQTKSRQVRQNCAFFHIAGNGVKLWVGVGGVLPVVQLGQICLVFLGILRGEKPDLVTQGVRTVVITGSSG